MSSKGITKGRRHKVEKDEGKPSDPLVYIPPNARTNNGVDSRPPQTTYDERQMVYDREKLKKVTRR